MEGDYDESPEDIYEIMKQEMMNCLGVYCTFGEQNEIKIDNGLTTYKKTWSHINEYFEAGVWVGLYEDELMGKYFELEVY